MVEPWSLVPDKATAEVRVPHTHTLHKVLASGCHIEMLKRPPGLLIDHVSIL